jgi:hypothetical protein
MSAIGPKRTFLFALHMFAFGGKADIEEVCSVLTLATSVNVRINAMDDMSRDQNEEENFLMYEIPDGVLETEACAGNEKVNNFAQ